MEVLGNATIYINGFKGKKGDYASISTRISSKNLDGDYEIAFLETRLSKDLREQLGVETIKDGDRIRYNVKLESAWLGAYYDKDENGKVYLFINDLSIIDNEKEEKKKTYKKTYRK